MKNPYGVRPTQYLKREESNYSIGCCPGFGPIFGNTKAFDIYITCEDSRCISYTYNDCTQAYDCDPIIKNKIYTNSYFSALLDYEVFTIDYQSKYTVYHMCKYPDLIWEYIQTKDISEESLSQINGDKEGLLNDLDIIHCNNKIIREKIKNIVMNPSEYLVNTLLVDRQYDSKLREWLGSDYKWKLIYRSSKHGYTAKSFHEHCDYQTPTLVIAKSAKGWIYGGYTTRSWSGWGIYNEMKSLLL